MEELEKYQIIELIKLAQLVNNCRVTKKAIRDGLSLEKFMDTVRATYRTDVQFRDLELNTSASVSAVNDQRSRHRVRLSHSRGRSKSRLGSKKSDSNKTCFRCGGDYPHQGDCPAKDKKCRKCGRSGHFEKKCHPKSKIVSRIYEDEYATVPCVSGGIQKNGTRCATIIMSGIYVCCLVDSGAEVNLIEDTFRKLKIKKLSRPAKQNEGRTSQVEHQ